MAYSLSLANRVRQVLGPRRGITEKRMFGGVGFLFRGNLLVGVWQQSLIVRLGPETATEALIEPHVSEFRVTGRPMKGWVVVDAEGLASDGELVLWIDRALCFVKTLPAK